MLLRLIAQRDWVRVREHIHTDPGDWIGQDCLYAAICNLAPPDIMRIIALSRCNNDYIPQFETDGGPVPLAMACQLGQAETVRALLDYGADVYQLGQYDNSIWDSIEDMDVALVIVERPNLDIDRILKQLFSSTYSHSDIQPPPELSLQIATRLLERDARENKGLDRRLERAFCFAIKHSQFDYVRLCIRHGASLYYDEVLYSVFNASNAHILPMLQLLLQHGLNPMIKTDDGFTVHWGMVADRRYYQFYGETVLNLLPVVACLLGILGARGAKKPAVARLPRELLRVMANNLI